MDLGLERVGNWIPIQADPLGHRVVMSALGIFIFINTWNNFFIPLIFLNSPDLFTVPLMLNQFRGQYTVDWTLLMAGTAIAAIPVLVVYIIGQRKIIEGITLTGLTGR